ncbi:MAG: hypothetical protein HKN12_03655, partial [Gemmatimonadetes bacterium]|nr:hypothetical protein [Gemmatimonadota bacterium]
MRTFVLGLVALTLMIIASVVVASPTSNPQSYPLSTCIVSGEPLGSHAEPFHHQAGDREILLCCEDCAAAFEKDTAGYLAKLDERIIATQRDGYALETCVISGEPLGSMGRPAPLLIGNRMVQLC